jgi:hypothetical protein
MVYVDRTYVTSSATADTTGSAYVIDLGSLYQPYVTTHQPYGFDTMATLYRRYRVNAVSIELTLLNPSTSLVTAIWGVVPPGASFSLSTLANAQTVAEKPFFNTANLLTRDGGHCSKVVRMKLPAHVACGLSKSEFDANVEEYSALCTASPNRTPKLTIATCSPAGAATQLNFDVKICYHAEFFERIVLPAS